MEVMEEKKVWVWLLVITAGITGAALYASVMVALIKFSAIILSPTAHLVVAVVLFVTAFAVVGVMKKRTK